MTQDAQGALRRIMETYARITRFCLVCNYVTRCVRSQVNFRDANKRHLGLSSPSHHVVPSSASLPWITNHHLVD